MALVSSNNTLVLSEPSLAAWETDDVTISESDLKPTTLGSSSGDSFLSMELLSRPKSVDIRSVVTSSEKLGSWTASFVQTLGVLSKFPSQFG